MNSIVGNSYVTYLVKYTRIPLGFRSDSADSVRNPHGMGGECEVLPAA